MTKNLWLILIVLFVAGCSGEPTSVEDLKQAGQKAFLKGDYTTAIKYLTQAYQHKASDRDILYFLGVSYQREYLVDSALVYLKRADLLFPFDREINLSIYNLALEAGEWEYAARAIHALVRTGDPIDKYLEELVELNIKMENLEVARAYLTLLHDKQPENADYYLRLATVSAAFDSTDYAIALMDTAISKFPDRENYFRMNKGIFLTHRKDYNDAEKIFRTLLATDTGSVQLKVNLANVLSKRDSRDKKLEALKLYGEIDPAAGAAFRVDSSMAELKKELNLQ